MNSLTLIIILLIATLIGAIPLGLVNLTVLNVSYHKGISKSMQIAHGAAFVEIVFVLIALFAGNFIKNTSDNHVWVHWLFVIVPAFVGVIFIAKKTDNHGTIQEYSTGFFKGIYLNLISIQVLLYWVLAMALITHNWLHNIQTSTILLIIASVWLGKMAVLWLYAKFSKLIFIKFKFLAKNINLAIGLILIITGILQYFK